MKTAVRWLLAALAMVANLTACAPPSRESPTQGHLVVAVAESYAGLVRREAGLFASLYPQSQLDVRAATTRDAFVSLLADSVNLVVVDRLPNSEELQSIDQLRLDLEMVPIAEDALALVVNGANPVQSLSMAEAAELFAGRAQDWGAITGDTWAQPVEVVTTGRNSGSWELLADRFFPGAAGPVPGTSAPTQREVLRRVAASPGAIGVVSVAAWREPARGGTAATAAAGEPGWASGVTRPEFSPAVRPLAIAGTDAAGHPAVQALHQANIHRGSYPLHFPVHVIFNKRSLLAAGFCAFMASAPGQRLVLDAGLVPATMPVRLVQLR
jgi:phosphate transport system substrate-binding protein